MTVTVNQTYVNMISSFKTDCDSLLTNFKSERSENFKDFAQIWKAFKFNLVYEKYAKDGLQLDFKEDTLQIAKHIMLHDDFVGGFYLLYGLYFVQEEPKSSIRLELQELERLLRLLKEERKTLMGTCQPGFLFAKLLRSDAFAFVKFSREFSMEGQSRARLIFDGQPILMQTNKRVNPSDWWNGFLKKLDFVEDMKQVEIDYFTKKQKLKEEHPELNLALDMVPDDIIGGIHKVLTVGESDSNKISEIGETRRRLRERKMKIKRKYGKRQQSVSEDEGQGPCSSSLQPKVKRFRGPPKGRQKSYFKSVINDPEEETSSSSSDLDDIHLSLPDL